MLAAPRTDRVAPFRERLWFALQRVAALLALIVALPLFALLYLAVRLTSPGPFLYSQRRPGLAGHPITVLKIRSMRQGSDQVRERGLVVRRGDPAVTGVGRVLRDLKLDELPQLWNVVRGEMAVVGPRPIAFALHHKLVDAIPGFEERLAVRPGLTSVSQVALLDNDEGDVVRDWAERFEGERHYIRNRTVSYDLVVITMTALLMAKKIARRVRRNSPGPAPVSWPAADAGVGAYPADSAS